MSVAAPLPEELELTLANQALSEATNDSKTLRNDQVKAENFVAAKYWGSVQYRIIATFLFFSICWIGVIYLGVTQVLQLWLCLVVN